MHEHHKQTYPVAQRETPQQLACAPKSMLCSGRVQQHTQSNCPGLLRVTVGQESGPHTLLLVLRARARARWRYHRHAASSSMHARKAAAQLRLTSSATLKESPPTRAPGATH